MVGDADAAEGVSRLAHAGFWVELCAGASLFAARQLRENGRISPADHVLLLITAKGDRDSFQFKSV